MSTFSQFAGGGGIKSIQRGVITINGGGATGSATITAVNTAKSELRLLGIGGYSNDTGNGTPLPGRIQLASGTSVTFNSPLTAASTSYVSWELTEWN